MRFLHQTFFAGALSIFGLAALSGCSLDASAPDSAAGAERVGASQEGVATTVRVAAATSDGGVVDRGECTPGTVETDGCPRCGTRTRGCYADGSRGDWGRCENKKDCELGDVMPLTCGDGTVTERRCTSTCTWGEAEAECAPAPTEPGGGTTTEPTAPVIAPDLMDRIGRHLVIDRQDTGGR